MARDRRERRRRGRLSRSGDFDRAFREGRSHANRYLVVYAFPRGHGERDVRLGVSAGRKLGGAVERNRIKRVLREAFWALADRLPPGHDFVIVARADLLGLLERDGAGAVRSCLSRVAEEAGLLRERST